MKRVTVFCRSIAIFCCICGKKEQHKRHSRKKSKQKTKQTESQIKRNERRNEREQDIYTKGRDFEWRNTRPIGLELARRIAEFCSGATRIRANFGRERGTSAAFLNVSGKGWREKVPELYEKPSKKSESDEAEEGEAAVEE